MSKTISGNLTLQSAVKNGSKPFEHAMLVHTVREQVNGKWQDKQGTNGPIKVWYRIGKITDETVKRLLAGDAETGPLQHNDLIAIDYNSLVISDESIPDGDSTKTVTNRDLQGIVKVELKGRNKQAWNPAKKTAEAVANVATVEQAMAVLKAVGLEVSNPAQDVPF